MTNPKFIYKEFKRFIEAKGRLDFGRQCKAILQPNGDITLTWSAEYRYKGYVRFEMLRIKPSGRITFQSKFPGKRSTWNDRMRRFFMLVNPQLWERDKFVIIPLGYGGGSISLCSAALTDENGLIPHAYENALSAWRNNTLLSIYFHGLEHTLMPSTKDGNVKGYIPAQSPGQRGLVPVKDWKRKHFFKTVTEDGSGGYAGHHRYGMPTTDLPTGRIIPGDWHEVEGDLKLCRNGIHICSPEQQSHWLGSRARYIVEMEAGDTVYQARNGSDNKLITRKARVKRIVADLLDPHIVAALSHGNQNEIIARICRGQKMPTFYEATAVYTWQETRKMTFTAKTMREARRKATTYSPLGWHQRSKNYKTAIKTTKLG